MIGSACVTTLTIIEPHDRLSPAIEDAMIATLKSSGRTVQSCRYPIPPYGLDRRGGQSLRVIERLTSPAAPEFGDL